jgi:hypothetical protein
MQRIRGAAWFRRSRWGPGLGAMIVSIGCTVSCGSPVPTTTESVRARGGASERVVDMDLESMLLPSAAVEDAGLYSVAGLFFYEARLKEPPGHDFLDRYQELLFSRGVLIRALGGSPHAVVPRLLGWETRCIRPGRVKPFSYFETVFVNRPEGSGVKSSPWSTGDILRLEGDSLRLDLGQRRAPWSEVVLVPNEDQESARELPFMRFPGAVLLAQPVPIKDRDLLDSTNVGRRYVAQAGSFEDVLSHYQSEMQRLGIVLRVATDRRSASWSGGVTSGLVSVSIGEDSLVLLGRFPLDQARRRWPRVFQAYPEEVVRFYVSAYLTDNAAAAAYWTPEEQQRRAALLGKRETK